MASSKTIENHDIEQLEGFESAALLAHKKCHRCSSNMRTGRNRGIFKTIVLIALAYICFLETSTRLIVQDPAKHVYRSGKVPYCKQILVGEIAPHIW